MRLSIQRQPSSGDATIGALYVNGTFQCFSLEDVIREIPGVPVDKWKVWGKTAIPAGEYEISIRQSPKFDNADKIHIEGVPGFDQIMVHEGNTAVDTHGCVLVGQSKTGFAAIGNSRAALKELQPLVAAALAAKERVYIQVLNPPVDPVVTT